jgi:hypothetical protein
MSTRPCKPFDAALNCDARRWIVAIGILSGNESEAANYRLPCKSQPKMELSPARIGQLFWTKFLVSAIVLGDTVSIILLKC